MFSIGGKHKEKVSSNISRRVVAFIDIQLINCDNNRSRDDCGAVSIRLISI